ncbi:MAG: hypothetical protein IJZ39_02505 [Oscillospiraceae bacterium]|nr:hypothetical protein [Oscillospiraceae bacterium]
MRRILIVILALLLLCGCGADVEPTVPPTQPTQPPIPWTEEVGIPWDAEGVLLEIPLTIPDGLHYSGGMGFDGDLLLWSVDTHRTDITTTELCLVELDDGHIIAQRDIALSEYVTPQVLGDDLYLCDRTSGQILQLDKELKTIRQWNTEPNEGSWYMGDGEKLYQFDMEEHFTVRDLSTGQSGPVIEGDPAYAWMTCYDGYMTMEYYSPDTGAKTHGVLDLYTGEILYPDLDEEYSSISYQDGNWLCSKYLDGYIFYFSADGAPFQRLPRQEDHVTMLPEGYLLETATDNTCLRLYDLEGKLVSSACIFESGNGYPKSEMIWNESLGGYFLQVFSYDENARLLFWDISRSAGGGDLEFMEIPTPEEAQVQLQQRAQKIGQEHGLIIKVGDDCDTVFDEFSAEIVTDWDQITMALDTLEEALEAYPDGFIQQLRHDNIRSIEVQLITNLWADGSGRYGDGYAAFAQPLWDHYLLVMDIEDTSAQTYYHEFSHIIDVYLEWEAGQREGALFSEEGWDSFNPGWFTDYSYDYSDEHALEDYNSFVDGYSTIKPTEDRARVMEYAMAGGEWVFEDAPILYSKLEYYSKCIRDAFDTTGWPEITRWEEPLQ